MSKTMSQNRNALRLLLATLNTSMNFRTLFAAIAVVVSMAPLFANGEEVESVGLRGMVKDADLEHRDLTLKVKKLKFKNPKLGRCKAHCYADRHCREGLKCWKEGGVPPGCIGMPTPKFNYCYKPDESASPTPPPTPSPTPSPTPLELDDDDDDYYYY